MSKPSLIRVSHAYQIGLLGGLGVLTAVMLGNALLSIASILTSIITALFLALGLEPLIQILEKRVKRRAIAISIVGLGLIGLITMVIVVILPPLISQASEFLTHLPELLKCLVQPPWISDLDARFDGAVSNALTSSGEYLADSKNWPNLLGGVVQVGLSILNGTAAFLNVFILSI